jgi:uncharacterized OB-fold protein
MAAECKDCKNVILPPKPMCPKCFSTNLQWTELHGTGKLISYTVIYVAPQQFQSMTPYAVGIVEFEKNLRLPGIIRGINSEKIKIGMNMKIDFDETPSVEWPAWPRYYFKPTRRR